MINLIQDKERHNAWVEYIKRPVPPKPEDAFDWAWIRQEQNIKKLQAEIIELKEKIVNEDKANDYLRKLIRDIDKHKSEYYNLFLEYRAKCEELLKERGE